MEKINGWISRIVVDFGAFDEEIINMKFKDIEHQAQQFGGKKKKECIHWRWNNNNSNVVLQKIHVEWKC